MSQPPDDSQDHDPCVVGGPEDGDLPEDIESEPRQRWRPKAELLRALEDARRDLKPGESNLFWDWTATRDSAPEAENLRPSGEGEVLVSDKEAAAAYVAPKEVAPALAPRAGTKSRIRVRPDLDPRRQPTVRNPREGAPAAASHRASVAHHHRRSSPSGSHRLKRPALPAVRDLEDTTAPTVRSQVDTPLEFEQPMHGPERRRRLAWAFFFGMVTGIIVFFWLRLPRDIGTGPASHGSQQAASTQGSSPMLRFEPPHRPAPVAVPPDASLDTHSVIPDPAALGATDPARRKAEDAPAGTPATAATVEAPAAPAPTAPAPTAPAPTAKPSAPPHGPTPPPRDKAADEAPSATPTTAVRGFLIRTKGPKSP